MPHHRTPQFARRLYAYTGEPHRVALDRLRRFPGRPIPTASAAQQHLEHEILRHIGYCGITDGHGWRPGDGPFSIDWLGPLPDALEIGVTETALPDLLGALLPTWTPGDEPRGVRGLRPHFAPRGVELRRLGLPGLLRLPGVRRQTFMRAAAVGHEMIWDDPDLTLMLWRTNPDQLHPEEQAHANGFDAGYAPESDGRAEMAATASALLRRHMIFRASQPATDIRVWMNPGSVQVEWDAGPDHLTVIDALLDPVFGTPGQVKDRCTCREAEPRSSRCYSLHVEFPDAFVNLRRGRDCWSPQYEQISARARQQRVAALQRHRGAHALAYVPTC
ncbi:hypothetical protein [Actinoplanes sp. NPDC051411]|uniref:hypothetical protein n=1 Tax=Actinoplanes sp. NPDC051411 TaxID=3155522 RepID=UPI00343D9413